MKKLKLFSFNIIFIQTKYKCKAIEGERRKKPKKILFYLNTRFFNDHFDDFWVLDLKHVLVFGVQ